MNGQQFGSSIVKSAVSRKKISGRVKEAENEIFSWGSSVQNFISQVMEFDNEGSKRLCRYNLREAASKLPKVQSSFQIIATETQEYFNFSELDKNEKFNYLLLAEMLDIIYDKLNSSPIRNFKEYIRERRKTENNKKIDEIKSLLKPLEDKGFNFTYPKELIIDGNEISTIISFEVVDFRFGIEQMGAIIECLANVSFDYWYLHIVPLVNGNTYLPQAWRISHNSIKEIISGDKANAWALLPLEASKELLSYIPNNHPVEILESQFIARFNDLIHSFHIVRRIRELLNRRLNTSLEPDNELAKIYEYKASEQMQRIGEEAEKLFDEMKTFTSELVNSNASDDEKTTWIDLVQNCLNKYKLSIENVNTSLSEEENKDFWSNREVEFHLGEHLNLKFKRFA